MRTVKNEAIEKLVDLVCILIDKRCLKKIALSKPDFTDIKRSVITPKSISNNFALQQETFSMDNKAFHRNIFNDFKSELLVIFEGYAQINVISTVGDAQYMRSKSGKTTLIGETKIIKSLENEDLKIVSIKSNNKDKKYILDPSTEMFKKLGISDETGRVRDRMQSKFRQINKFIEHIEAIQSRLPAKELNIYDLCCGKSYLSFAVYHYFKNILNMNVRMVCVDLKSDVIEYCDALAKRLGFDEMQFVCKDINEYKMENHPDLVISLHACDIATDIVLNKASENNATVILATPCCHHELNHTINCKPLEFVTRHSMLRQKMCDALTDSLRLLKLECEGYKVDALELIDPEDTPKNIMLRAIKKKSIDTNNQAELKREYENVRKFLLGK